MRSIPRPVVARLSGGGLLLAAVAACGPPTHATTDIENACSAIDARLATVQRHGLALDTTFVHPWMPEERRGCVVTASDTTGGAPIDDVIAALQDLGWAQDWRISADGPDGTMQGARRDDLLCVLEGRWDGGDDSDSTYVPAPGYRLQVACWRAQPKDVAP